MTEIQVTPESLDDLASKCGRQAESVGDIGRTVTGDIENTQWHSPAAEAFRADWSGTYLPALQKLQEALQGLGEAAKQRAQAYRDADRPQ